MFASDGSSRLHCGFAIVPKPTVSWTMCARDGSIMALLASVSRMERVRYGFPTASRASVTQAVRISLQKIRQANVRLVDDKATCVVAHYQTCRGEMRAS